jgi:hypothetical protein
MGAPANTVQWFGRRLPMDFDSVGVAQNAPTGLRIKAGG